MTTYGIGTNWWIIQVLLSRGYLKEFCTEIAYKNMSTDYTATRIISFKKMEHAQVLLISWAVTELISHSVIADTPRAVFRLLDLSYIYVFWYFNKCICYTAGIYFFSFVFISRSRFQKSKFHHGAVMEFKFSFLHMLWKCLKLHLFYIGKH